MVSTYIWPHPPEDERKIEGMVETLREGGQLPPILVSGEFAFTGSHRLEAWDRTDTEPRAVELSDEDYKATMEMLGLDWRYDSICDYNEFCTALYAVTDDPKVKVAVEDQRGY